jgi:glycosyltransferase involved in cell wall biosynthesis
VEYNLQEIKAHLNSGRIRALFLVWDAPQGSHRSQFLAQALGIRVEHVYLNTRKGRLYAPIKYAFQAIKSLLLLSDLRPNLVFVQAPPIFAALTVYIYSKVRRTKFIIDSHTDALLASWWAWSLPVHSFLSRRGITTIVTNRYLESLVSGWGASAFVLVDPPIYNLSLEEVHINRKDFNVMMVSSVSYDEPINNVLEAVRNIPDVNLYISGKFPERRPNIVEEAPENVRFTGFLPDDQYYGLMKAVQAVMSLTTENHTIQSGANEALWMGKPIITSDWSILRETFSKGTIHVDNSVEGIYEAICRMRNNYKDYEEELCEFQIEQKQKWENRLSNLFGLILDAYKG